MPDEMPVDEARHALGLVPEFLRPILAQVQEAERRQAGGDLHVNRLRDRDERHLGALLARVGNLSDVIAPPYDVIDPALQQELYERSSHNVIRLILNRETPSDTDGDNRYTRSGQALRDWTRDGILAQDSARALYVCHQD